MELRNENEKKTKLVIRLPVHLKTPKAAHIFCRTWLAKQRKVAIGGDDCSSFRSLELIVATLGVVWVGGRNP
jgi:hypothetical protein